MVIITCDVCKAPALSSHQVDRYAFRMDLCEKHLGEWVAYAMEKLDAYINHNAVLHNLSRAIMDVVVAGAQYDMAQGTAPKDGPKSGPEALQRMADHFIKINTPV